MWVDRFVSLFIACVMVAGCTVKPGDAHVAPALSIDEMCRMPRATLGDNAVSVTRALGVPLDQSTTPTLNKHNAEQVDQRKMLRYSGLDVLVYDVPAYERAFLESVSFSRPNPRFLGDLRFATPQAYVLRRHGEPYQRDDSELVYLCSGEIEEIVVFAFEEDQLQRVIWQAFID